MKKVLCLLISVIIVFTSVSAFAEAFTIHSGVQFGMTMDEVIQKENDAGFTNAFKMELEESMIYNCPEDHDTVSVRVYGQIAGVNNSKIMYHFSDNGGLDSALYLLGRASDDMVYTNIRKSLIKKYGEPDKTLSAVWHAFLDMDVYSDADYFTDNPNVSGTNMKFNNIKCYYDESWLIPQDDGGYVIITGYNYSKDLIIGSPNDTMRNFYTYIGYQYFSKVEIENAISKATEIANKYYEQLEDDL